MSLESVCVRRLAGVLALSGGLSMGAGCEPAFEAPCRIVDQRSVLDTPHGTSPLGVGGLSGQLGALRPVERSDGSLVFRWWRIDSDPSDALDSLVNGTATATKTAELAVLGPDGSLLERRSIQVPSSDGAVPLSTRDFVWTDDGIAFVALLTADEGAMGGVQSRLVLYNLAEDGTVTSSAGIMGATCDDCMLTWSTAAFEERVVVLYADRSRKASENSEVLPLVALALSSTGEILSSRTLATPSSSSLFGGPSFTLIADREFLLIQEAARVRRIDADLNEVGGTIDLPENRPTQFSWEDDAAAVVWTQTGTTTRRTSPDLLLQVFDEGGATQGSEERLSTAQSILGVRRFGPNYGVVFIDGPETFFAATEDSTQRKIGGDVSLRSNKDSASRPQSGVIVPRGRSGIIYFELGSENITRVEVQCVP